MNHDALIAKKGHFGWRWCVVLRDVWVLVTNNARDNLMRCGEVPTDRPQALAQHKRVSDRAHLCLREAWRSRATTISHLFRCGRPSAVPRRVRTIVVDSVNRMLRRRFWPHVVEEGFKRVAPFIAHGNAASPIQTEVRAGLVKATALDGAPSRVFASGVLLSGVTVLKPTKTRAPETAAAFCTAAPQIDIRDMRDRATLAAAF